VSETQFLIAQRINYSKKRWLREEMVQRRSNSEKHRQTAGGKGRNLKRRKCSEPSRVEVARRNVVSRKVWFSAGLV
jgi:hypothetical protein